MSKHLVIRLFMVAFLIGAGMFVVAVRAGHPTAETEECRQDKTDCVEKESQSEFLLQGLTRKLLNG